MRITDDLEVVDINLALEMIGGYEQVYQKVVNCFIETNANLVQEVTNNLETDINEARRLVHSCKGISENIGSRRLYEVSKNLELAILNGDKELINDQFIDFKEVFYAVLRDLQKIKF